MDDSWPSSSDSLVDDVRLSEAHRLWALASDSFQSQDWAAAVSLGSEARTVFATRGITDMEGKCSGGIGASLLKLGQLDLAEVELTHSLECFRSTGDGLRQMIALGWLAALYTERAEESAECSVELRGKAIESLSEAIDIGERDIGADTPRFRGQCAVSRLNRGVVLYSQGESSLAVTDWLDALRAFKALPKRGRDIALCSWNLGDVHYVAGRWTDAEQCFALAADALPKNAEPERSAKYSGKRGVVLARLARYAEGRELIREAICGCDDLGNGAQAAFWQMELGWATEESGDKRAAAREYKAALQRAIDGDLEEHTRNTYKIRAEFGLTRCSYACGLAGDPLPVLADLRLRMLADPDTRSLVGYLDWFHAVILLDRADFDGAGAVFVRARKQFENAGEWLLAAEIDIARAKALDLRRRHSSTGVVESLTYAEEGLDLMVPALLALFSYRFELVYQSDRVRWIETKIVPGLGAALSLAFTSTNMVVRAQLIETSKQIGRVGLPNTAIADSAADHPFDSESIESESSTMYEIPDRRAAVISLAPAGTLVMPGGDTALDSYHQLAQQRFHRATTTSAKRHLAYMLLGTPDSTPKWGR